MKLLGLFMNSRIWGRGAGAVNPGLVLATIVVFVVLCFASPYFLTTNNLLNVAKALVIVGIAAAGETVVIISGGFDLSIGSTMAAAGMLAAYLLDMGTGTGIAFCDRPYARSGCVSSEGGVLAQRGARPQLWLTPATKARTRKLSLFAIGHIMLEVGVSAVKGGGPRSSRSAGRAHNFC